MTSLVGSVSEFLEGAREARRRDAIGAVAAANYQVRFEEIDRLARELRDAGAPEASVMQSRAEIAWRAAQAELRNPSEP